MFIRLTFKKFSGWPWLILYKDDSPLDPRGFWALILPPP
jgi:hypothetical protein